MAKRCRLDGKELYDVLIKLTKRYDYPLVLELLREELGMRQQGPNESVEVYTADITNKGVPQRGTGKR